MDVVATLVANAQATVLMQPGDGALDHPALAAQPGAVRTCRPGDPCLDAAAAQFAPALAGVVGAVAIERTRTATWAATAAAHGRDGIEQRDHLGDVVAVAAGEPDGERCPTPAGNQMVLGAPSGAVDWAWTGLGAPPKARTCELSIAARDQSIRSAR